ncbi:MAG TPA: hypothetical protein VGJ13_14675 [Pseudonocardiaceae bacterium]
MNRRAFHFRCPSAGSAKGVHGPSDAATGTAEPSDAGSGAVWTIDRSPCSCLPQTAVPQPPVQRWTATSVGPLAGTARPSTAVRAEVADDFASKSATAALPAVDCK